MQSIPVQLPCAARVGRGLAKLGFASNNASPDPPAAALLGSAQGWHGAQPYASDYGRDWSLARETRTVQNSLNSCVV